MSNRRLDWWGAVVLLLVLVVVLSGIGFSWFYFGLPSSGRQSMKDLELIALWGPIFRAIHRWAAYGTLVGIGMWSYHAVRGGRPGAVMGVMLATVVMVELVTGFFLPWDKLALWMLPGSHPSLPGSGILPAPTDIIMWYGLHLAVLPLVGVGLALAACRKTRSVLAPPTDR